MHYQNYKNMKSYENYNKELVKLAKFIPGFYKLSLHQRQQAIDDSYMNLMSKMTSGHVPADNYEDYKFYMFITLKNTINRNFEYDKTYNGKGHKLFIEDQSTNSFVQKTKTPDMDMSVLKKLFNQLPPRTKAYIRWASRGWSHQYIADAFNTNKCIVNRTIQKARKQLKEAMTYEKPESQTHDSH